YSPTATDVGMLIGSIGLFLALYLSLSARMPEERLDPLDAAPAARTHQGTTALLGGAGALALLLFWSSQTQWSDLAGSLKGVPQGPIFHLPGMLVSALLGAGLACAIHFFIILRRHE
ncbi:MAG TPA: hypothetical protein H9862_07040, partial [Candidatus Akkermansia intestinigallinarum]|nr:hypothetical protein [Candidatus Akkermansia intestinigallinarum]